MGIALKLFGMGLFVTFIYFSVDIILVKIMDYGLPVLPETVRWLGSKSCLFSSLNIFIKIVIMGFIAKQIIGYTRAL